MKQERIEAILNMEWNMFVRVNNEGGQASCQRDPNTFFKQRGAQFSTWSERMLESYLEDLCNAKATDRNLLTEKYAYMMESTSPEEYAKLRELLPEITAEKRALIDDIIHIHMEWAQDTALLYPGLSGLGRPLNQAQGDPSTTSLEAYQRGELATYSCETLRLYFDHVKSLKEHGRNMNLMILENTIERYGYQSLDAAERSVEKQLDIHEILKPKQ